MNQKLLIMPGTFKGVVDDKQRTIRHLISAETIDRDGEVLSSKGCKYGAYLASNPVVFLNHQAKELPIGKSLSVSVLDKEVEATTQFAGLEQLHELAERTYRLYRDQFMSAWSVGFSVIRATRDMLVRGQQGRSIMDWELLEYSAVGIPSNPQAVSRMVKEFRGAGLITLPDGASEDDLGKALGTVPLAKYWDAGLPLFAAEQRAREDRGSSIARSCGCPYEQWAKGGPAHVAGCALESKSALSEGLARAFGMVKCTACGKMIAEDATTCKYCDAPVTPAKAKEEEVEDDEDDAEVECPHCGEMVPADSATCPECEMSMKKSVEPEEDKDLRWNESLSKLFDVTRVQGDPATVEYGHAARYLDCEVKELRRETEFVSAAKMGSYLAALDETLRDWTVVDVRNWTREGKEAPVGHEVVQLNSTTRRDFVVDGLRFLRKRLNAVDVKLVVKVEPDWRGMYVTTYVDNAYSSIAKEFSLDAQIKAAATNYLKGEAFALSGAFLTKTGETWADIFLTEKNEAALRGAVAVINAQGATMDNLGICVLGPPGTGKTLGARVMMNEAKSTFIWVSARDFWRGGGMGTVDHAFELAKECAPTVLVFEDVDNHMSGEVIDLFKSKMDGADGHKTGVVTMLTTNFPETFPEALIDRPGRFDRVLKVDLPDDTQREQMLKKWCPALDNECRTDLMIALAGYSGAHIKALVRFAARRLDALDESEKSGDHAWADAMTGALAELKEQRELISSTQAPRYRPHRDAPKMLDLYRVEKSWVDVGGVAVEVKAGRRMSAARFARLQAHHTTLGNKLAEQAAEHAAMGELVRELEYRAPAEDGDEPDDRPALTELATGKPLRDALPAEIRMAVRMAIIAEDRAARSSATLTAYDERALADIEAFAALLGAHDGGCTNADARCPGCQQLSTRCAKHVAAFEDRKERASVALSHLRDRIMALTTTPAEGAPPAPARAGLFADQKDKDALTRRLTESLTAARR